MTSTVFAATNNISSLESKVASNLKAFGVSDAEIGNVLEYLQSINMTKAQENQLLAYIDEAEKVAGGRTDLTTLSPEKKLEIQRIAKEAGAVVGLTVKFSKESGKNVLTALKPDGSKLLTLNADNAKNVQWSVLRETVSASQQYSQATSGSTSDSTSGSTSKVKGGSGSSTKYYPSSHGGYRKTATNIGNMLAVGLGLISVSSVVLIKRRKEILG